MENEEIRRREDFLEAKLKEKEETCEEREAKIVSLRKELEQIKKGCKSSQILETIMKNQKPQHDKFGIGFKGESSSTKNSAKIYADALSTIQKKKKYVIKSPSQIRRMKRELLQRIMWSRIMDITTNTNLYSTKGPSQIRRMRQE